MVEVWDEVVESAVLRVPGVGRLKGQEGIDVDLYVNINQERSSYEYMQMMVEYREYRLVDWELRNVCTPIKINH